MDDRTFQCGRCQSGGGSTKSGGGSTKIHVPVIIVPPLVYLASRDLPDFQLSYNLQDRPCVEIPFSSHFQITGWEKYVCTASKYFAINWSFQLSAKFLLWLAEMSQRSTYKILLIDKCLFCYDILFLSGLAFLSIHVLLVCQLRLVWKIMPSNSNSSITSRQKSFMAWSHAPLLYW